MIRGESKGPVQDFVWSNVWGWLFIFPLLLSLLWVTGYLDDPHVDEVVIHATH